MARPDFPRSMAEFQSRFGSDDSCRRYLMACRRPEGFRCPACDDHPTTSQDLKLPAPAAREREVGR